MRVLVLLGAPGAGKGTQAQVLARTLGIPHIATGDLFRAAVREGTTLGREVKEYMDRGELVPDGVTVGILLDRLSASDARDGAILDGFPRTRAQAEALDAELAGRGVGVDRALYIDVPSEDIVRRLSGRWICEAAGHVYNVASRPPRAAGRCDIDESALVQRDDDRAETVRARLGQQMGALGEVAAHYRATGALVMVDGGKPIAEVTEALLDVLRPAAERRVG